MAAPRTPTARKTSSSTDTMAEAESVSARKATLMNPTEDFETAPVLLRRLFERGRRRQGPGRRAYQGLWREHRAALCEEAVRPEPRKPSPRAIPLHPDVLATLKGKTVHVERVPARARHVCACWPAPSAHLWTTAPRRCHGDSLAPYGLGPRADPPRAGNPPRPSRLRAGHRQRQSRRRQRNPIVWRRTSTPSITAACRPTPPTSLAPHFCTPWRSTSR